MDDESDEKLTDEQKLWTIVSRIREALTKQSREECRLLVWDLMHNGINFSDIEGIFAKLEKDENVLELVSMPEHLSNDPYDYKNTDIVIKVLKGFDKYYEKLEEIFGLSIAKLNGMNFLKVLDVIGEIKELLNITDKNTMRIPLWQQIIRYPSLMPADSTGLRDRYCQFRLEAVEFLKKIGALESFEILKAFQRWDSQIEITVKRLRITEVFGQMDKRWKDFSIAERRKILGIKPDPEIYKTEDIAQKQLSYEDKNCVLIIGKHEVQIPINTAQSELCRVIFEDSESMAKDWSYDELHKRIEGSEDYKPDNWRKYYNSANSVNEKIALETHIKKFLKPTKKSVRIDDDYLEKYSKVEVENTV